MAAPSVIPEEIENGPMMNLLTEQRRNDENETFESLYFSCCRMGLSTGLTPCDSVETSSTFSNENSSISSEEENTSSEEPVHVHELAHVDAVAATCTEDGNVEYWQCAECGKYFSDEACENEVDSVIIPATGHTLEHVEYKAPTCAKGNIEYWYCTSCGKYFSDENANAKITLADTVLPQRMITNSAMMVFAKPVVHTNQPKDLHTPMTARPTAIRLPVVRPRLPKSTLPTITMMVKMTDIRSLSSFPKLSKVIGQSKA